MESKGLRKVLFKIFIPEQYHADDNAVNLYGETLIEGTGCWSGFEKIGVFHCWGNSLVFESDNAITVTIAIIEDKFGNIYEVLPRNIKFNE